MPYAIHFVSKNLSLAEVNYTVIEKELLVVVHAINKFRHYIIGYQAFVHTDHSTIKFLMRKPITNPRVIRWLLLLQEFNINIIDRPGKDNLVADFLSRMIHLGDNAPVDDTFPDKNLFSISTFTPWYVLSPYNSQMVSEFQDFNEGLNLHIVVIIWRTQLYLATYG